jgi:ankyrin repeat protein
VVHYVQVKRDGATPLFMAAQNGHAAIAELLLENDADTSLTLQDGASPLFVAAQNKCVRLVL